MQVKHLEQMKLEPTAKLTVWLASGMKLDGVHFTYDVSGWLRLEQLDGQPIMVSIDHIAALQLA